MSYCRQRLYLLSCLGWARRSYTSKSTRGGFITAAVCWTIFLLVLNDLGEYLYGDLRETFRVDQTVAKEMQLNVDLVRTSCSDRVESS